MLICNNQQATIKKTWTILMQLRRVKNIGQIRSKCCQNSPPKIPHCVSRFVYAIKHHCFMSHYIIIFIHVVLIISVTSSTLLLPKKVKMGKMLVTQNDILKKPRSWRVWLGFFFQDSGFFCQPWHQALTHSNTDSITKTILITRS